MRAEIGHLGEENRTGVSVDQNGFTVKVKMAPCLLISPELSTFFVSLQRHAGAGVCGKFQTGPLFCLLMEGYRTALLLPPELCDDRWRAVHQA